MELVGKLSPKAIGWDRNRIGTEVAKVPADGGKVLLGRIVGMISGLKQTVNNETGDIQTGLKGNFRGISSVDGLAAVTSGVCYLPGGIQEMLEGALASAKENDAKATVTFAIDLFAIPATNKAGYSFKAENIVEAEASDPLAMLLEQANAVKPPVGLPALEAPKESEPEAEKPSGKNRKVEPAKVAEREGAATE
jgi:hypothetical protein